MNGKNTKLVRLKKENKKSLHRQLKKVFEGTELDSVIEKIIKPYE